MPTTLPQSLRHLLAARDPDARGRGWAAFMAEFSSLLLYTAQSFGGDRDAVMDRYAFVVDALRDGDCRRLRTFLAEGRGKFSTWLVAVVRRLCIDQHRHRYGRPQATEVDAGQWRERRDLTDLVGSHVELAEIEDADAATDERVVRAELRAAITAALQRLDARERLLLRLRFEDGCSVPEIARLIGAPSPFHIYRQLDRLLATLGRELRAVGIDSPNP